MGEDIGIHSSLSENFEIEVKNEKRKGVVCGIRVEEIEDPLMQKIRYLDKLIDEIGKGKKMEKILRG